MSVLKRGNKYWVDFRFNNQRHRLSSPENTLAGAKGYEATLRTKLARGEPILTQPEKIVKMVSFKEFSRDWMDVYVRNNNKPQEIIHKDGHLRLYLVPFFGKYPLDQIGNYEVELFKAKMAKTKLSEKTVNRLLSTLSICLKTAEEWELIKHVPRIKRVKVIPKKLDYLTYEEAQLLLTHSEGQIREMIFFALRTGVRFGELIALDWSDIDFLNKQITIRRSIVGGVMGGTKSNKIRYIPLNKSVSEMLIDRAQNHGFVFIRNGEPFTQHYCCKKIIKAYKDAGLKKSGWHKLRHTFASHLAQKGIAIQVIKELLGHSDITTTMQYAHLSPSALRAAMNVLETQDSLQINSGHNMVTIYDSPAFVVTSTVVNDDEKSAYNKQKQPLRTVSVV